MKYAVSEQGVMALKTMSAAISDTIDTINGLTSGLSACADEHQDTLGPHKASIDSVIEEIQALTNQATEPANNVAEALNDVAESYEEIIGNDRIQGSVGK